MMIDSTETQNDLSAQPSSVPVLTSETQIFPEDDLRNCSLCGELCSGDPCDECTADLGCEALAALADRLPAEEDSTLDEALRIGSGEEKLLLPTRAHAIALFEQLQRSERYARALEYAIGAELQETQSVKRRAIDAIPAAARETSEAVVQ